MSSILLFSTRDGMATLPCTLAAFERLRLPEGTRIVAVDNASRDCSVDLVRAAAARLPMTALEAPIAGKNRALNAALDRIAPWLHDAELVVVTDDDVVPRPDWLVQLHTRVLQPRPFSPVQAASTLVALVFVWWPWCKRI